MVDEIGFRLYGFNADDAEMARTYQYNIVHEGKYGLVYDRGGKPAGAVAIGEDMIPYLTNEDKAWLAETINDIQSRIKASVEYDMRTNKFTEFISRLGEELEREKQRLSEEQNE